MQHLTTFNPRQAQPLFSHCKEKLKFHVEDFPIARSVVEIYTAAPLTEFPEKLWYDYPEEFTKKVTDSLDIIMSNETDPADRISMLDKVIDTW